MRQRTFDTVSTLSLAEGVAERSTKRSVSDTRTSSKALHSDAALRSLRSSRVTARRCADTLRTLGWASAATSAARLYSATSSSAATSSTICMPSAAPQPSPQYPAAQSHVPLYVWHTPCPLHGPAAPPPGHGSASAVRSTVGGEVQFEWPAALRARTKTAYSVAGARSVALNADARTAAPRMNHSGSRLSTTPAALETMTKATSKDDALKGSFKDVRGSESNCEQDSRKM